VDRMQSLPKSIPTDIFASSNLTRPIFASYSERSMCGSALRRFSALWTRFFAKLTEFERSVGGHTRSSITPHARCEAGNIIGSFRRVPQRTPHGTPVRGTPLLLLICPPSAHGKGAAHTASAGLLRQPCRAHHRFPPNLFPPHPPQFASFLATPSNTPALSWRQREVGAPIGFQPT